MGQHLLMVRLQ